MNIQSLNHCGLLISDLEKSRWFYGTVLGMEEVPRPATFKFAGAWFRGGSCEVHMLVAPELVHPGGFGGTEIPGRPAFATHLAFEVQDFAEIVASMNQHGVKIKAGPLARGDGMVQIFVNDPDGYLLEFFGWVEGSNASAPEREAIN